MRPDHVTGLRYLGGPTAVLSVDGVTLLIDPTFDGPGDYPIGSRVLSKTAPALVGADEIGEIDAVLLSHDQHPDNLDHGGRHYVERAPLVLSTASAQARLGGPVRALPNWTHIDLTRPDGRALRITGVPAQHGPDGSEQLVGEVTGFVLSGDGLPSIYVSGDNASLAVVRAITERLGPFDVAVLFAGAAQTPLLGAAYLTLTSAQAAEAAHILGAPIIVPVHFEGWAHFTQGRDTLPEAFEAAGLRDRLRLLEPGAQIQLAPPINSGAG